MRARAARRRVRAPRRRRDLAGRPANIDSRAMPSPAAPPGPPYLGRTARIVGPVRPVETHDMPHQRNQRGELGKAMFNWIANTVAGDPLSRVSSGIHFGHKDNNLYTTLRGNGGAVSPDRVEVADPAVMTRHMKR